MSRPIDADALNAAIEKWFDGVCVYDVSPSEAVNDFQSIVEEQPTITANEVRPVGKWVKNHDEVMWWWECSNCKEKPLIARFGDAEVLSAYCPRCGVKLEIPEGE